MEDRKAKIEFIRNNSFGILFSLHEGGPWATHTPFIYIENEGSNDVLLCHMAKANPQWKDVESSKVLVVFQGPHAYITPSWYTEKNQVPTWNYVTVHATGTASLLDGEAKKDLIMMMLEFYQSDAGMVDHLEEEPFRSMLRATAGVRITVEKLEGKAKLNQNKSVGSRMNVAEQLLKSDNPVTRNLGRTMIEELASLDRK